MTTIFNDPTIDAVCVELGVKFHTQLDRMLGEETAHPDDPEHNMAVGQALYIGINFRAPALAADLYNRWARTHGYEPAVYIATLTNAVGARAYSFHIGIALVCIDADYQIQDVQDLRRSKPAPEKVLSPCL